jgi:hypothetical protein
MDEGPDFITLNVFARNTVNHVQKEPLATLANQEYKTKDGLFVDSRQSHGRAHAVAPRELTETQHGL